MLSADRMDKRRGVYRTAIVGRSNSSLACSAVRNPTCCLFVEFSCSLFQLSLRERTLLHEDCLLVCVVNAILAQCQHVVNRFFGAGRSFFASSGADERTCWHGVGTVWGGAPTPGPPPGPRRTMGPS